MRLKNVENLAPANDGVVVKVLDRQFIEDDIYMGGDEEATKEKVQMYYGEVEKLGPKSTNPEHCPFLEIGDTAIFSQFAGYHISTNDGEVHKLLRGYDIMATTKDVNSNTVDVLTPTANRLLLEVQYVDVDEDGIVLSDEDAKDPRLADMDYGRVIKVGPSCELGYEVGDLVAYSPWAGESLRQRGSADIPELKVIIEHDILLVQK